MKGLAYSLILERKLDNISYIAITKCMQTKDFVHGVITASYVYQTDKDHYANCKQVEDITTYIL